MGDYDTIVVGSGAGGLAAATALAQAGQRVLVLERQERPGGLSASFAVDGHVFDTGVHYLGQLQPGGLLRRIYEGMGVSRDLVFCEMNPEGFDHVVLGDRRFDICTGAERIADRLADAFPADARGLRRAVRTLSTIAEEMVDVYQAERPTELARALIHGKTAAQWWLAPLSRLLERYVDDPTARAVLSAQCGDHGLPPSRAPAVLHAMVASHYYEGAWYPMGGGGSLPRAWARALRGAGGELETGVEVERILVEPGGRGRRAVGVRVAGGRTIGADRIISNADPEVTFRQLVGPDELSKKLLRKLDRTRWSKTDLSLFMTARIADPSALGLDSGNIWWFRSPDVEALYREGASGSLARSGPFPGIFLTVTSLKDPTLRRGDVHSLEAFAFVTFDAFEKWQALAPGERPREYHDLKAALEERLLSSIERAVPGLRERLLYRDLATPLTILHYNSSTRGAIYGTEKTRWQLGPFAYRTKTEIDGLMLCGASTGSFGVMGSTFSGLNAARLALDCGFDDLLRVPGPALRTVPSDRIDLWPADLRPREATEARPA